MASDEEGPPTLADADDPATRTTPTADPSQGGERRIGPYRLLRELGHGGMGTVYLAARADEQFHKRVALKIIRGGADSAEVVRHFKRERQILASLDHPNIARLLDGGATDDGLPYLVMEYIEGEQILDYCDSRRLPIAQRLKLFQSVCSAVQYAHRNLVVHRDIKPGNILVAPDGGPRLLDFGIARLLNPELAGEAPTATSIAMTPAFASPEQVRGEHLTTATDVYSLGVVLYLLLTGRHPYRLASGQPLDVLRAISEQEPERPSSAVGRGRSEAPTARERRREGTTADPAPTMAITEAPATPTDEPAPEAVARTREGTPDKLMRRLRGDLDNMLLTALRKAPQDRYASVEALSDDIQRYLDGQPVAARKPTLGYRAEKFLRRHLAAAAASVAVLVLLAAFAVAMAEQSARVVRERDTARRERETAQRVAGFLVDLFKVSDPSEARGNTITAREVLDKGAARITTELKDQPEVRATLMDTMGNVFLNLGLYDKATHLLEQALASRRAVFGNEHTEVAASLGDLANAVADKGDYAGAVALDREALAMRRRLLGPEHRDVATSLNNLANAVADAGDYAEAEALHRDALAMRRKLLGPEHPQIAASLNNLANVYARKGDQDAAAALYREALAMDRKLVGNEHPDVATDMSNLASVLMDKGNYAEAEVLHREALALRRKLLGPEHPQVARNMQDLASLLALKGDYAGAEALHREVLALRLKLLAKDHPDVAMSLASLADTLCHEGKAAEAEPLAREALGVFTRTLPDDHPFVAETRSILGGSLALSRRYAEAEPLLVGSYPVLRTATGERSQETRAALQRLVGLYEAWGQEEKAARYRSQLATTPSDPR